MADTIHNILKSNIIFDQNFNERGLKMYKKPENCRGCCFYTLKYVFSEKENKNIFIGYYCSAKTKFINGTNITCDCRDEK